MPIPFIAAALGGFFAHGACVELGRRAVRAITTRNNKSKSSLVRPTVVIDSQNSDPSLNASQKAYYASIIKLKSDELNYRKNSDILRAKLDAAIAEEDQKIKRSELELKKHELTLKEKELIIQGQIAQLEHEDRQDLVNLKRQELQINLAWQNTQESIATLERNFRAEENQSYWNVLRELKQKDVEIKINEIQSKWDSIEKNWPSNCSRIETENFSTDLSHGNSVPLLLLVAPPNFSEDFSSTFCSKFNKELRYRIKKSLSDFKVDYYHDFFTRNIGDVDIKLLSSVLQLRPTAVFYTEIVKESIYIHVAAWGWPECGNYNFCEKINFICNTNNNTNDNKILENYFDEVQEQIISIYELTSMFLSDWYNLNYDLTYKPIVQDILEGFQLDRDVLDTYVTPLTNLYRFNQAQIHYQDGLNFSELGYYDQAVLCFKESLEFWPDFPEAESKLLTHEKYLAKYRSIIAYTTEFSFKTVKFDGNEKLVKTIKKNREFQEKLSNDFFIDMVYIPSGKFLMGSPTEEIGRYNYEREQIEVEISSFFMSKYLVTQEQWKNISKLPKTQIDLVSTPSKFKGANKPVECVSWHEVNEFCRRLNILSGRNYRLPNEAEWEYACRSNTVSPYSFGDNITAEIANFQDNAGQNKTEHTTVVGSFGIANNYGLYDMHGNLFEWCLDYSDDNYQVRRGGSWASHKRYCRSAYRYMEAAENKNEFLGFRIILPIDGMV